MEELQGRFYAQEYGMNVAIVRPANLYGPRDHFDPTISHVIPALIRRTLQAEETLQVWGSGEQTRTFLLADDAARALLDAGFRHTTADPINVGTEEEVTIRELVEIIIEATGKNIEPLFDTSAPEGQPRKAADISKAKRLLNWHPHYTLREGMRDTVDWYKKSGNTETP